MSKLANYAIVIAVSMGTSAMLDSRKRAINADASAESRLAVNGAFRDGMYLGKLAADNGEPQRPAVGRCPQSRIAPHSRPAMSGDTSNLSLALFHRNLPETNSSVATLSVICGVQEYQEYCGLTAIHDLPSCVEVFNDLFSKRKNQIWMPD